MGVVYLVHNREIPKPIVLKTSQKAVGEDAKRRFVSEATAWIKAGVHTNIVQAYWVREIAGQLFVAAEYIEPDEDDRNSLADFLKPGQLGVETILVWSTQFCRGMSYARSKGLRAHRDVKPDNLMIDVTGTLKITDFGLAKLIDSEAAGTSRASVLGRGPASESAANTQTGSMLGTLPYMAPEQFVDAKEVDHRADIYSFGVVLYQMVTGNQYPYRIRSDAADIAYEYFRAHTEQLPLRVESPLTPVIDRCLHKVPSRRYATYDALLADLTDVARSLGIKLTGAVHVAKEDEEIYAQAQSYGALGDTDRALAAIDEYVSKYPDNACGWTEKGRIHIVRREYPQGVAATRKSLDANPYNTHAWNNLGILLDRTQAPIAEVKAAYANALHFDPSNTGSMMNLIGPLVLHGEYSEAATLTARALKLRPDKPLILEKAGALLKDLVSGRHIAAAEILLNGWTKARACDVDAWHNLGLICLDQGKLDQAIECFKLVHQLAPEDNFSVLQLAKLYFKKRKGRECLDHCDRLLESGYEPLVAVSLKARVLNYMGWYKAAVEFLRPYIDHNPESDALWVVLSEIHEYRGDYDSAIVALESAKRLLQSGSSEHRAANLEFVDQKIQQLSGVK